MHTALPHFAFPGFVKPHREVNRIFDRTADAQTEEEAMVPYRRVRDEIREFVDTLPELLAESVVSARSASQ